MCKFGTLVCDGQENPPCLLSDPNCYIPYQQVPVELPCQTFYLGSSREIGLALFSPLRVRKECALLPRGRGVQRGGERRVL